MAGGTVKYAISGAAASKLEKTFILMLEGIQGKIHLNRVAYHALCVSNPQLR